MKEKRYEDNFFGKLMSELQRFFSVKKNLWGSLHFKVVQSLLSDKRRNRHQTNPCARGRLLEKFCSPSKA